jgi:hypothetical protein
MLSGSLGEADRCGTRIICAFPLRSDPLYEMDSKTVVPMGWELPSTSRIPKAILVLFSRNMKSREMGGSEDVRNRSGKARDLWYSESLFSF